jgi:dUTP pyrophosphatase
METNKITLNIKKIIDAAKLPIFGSESAAGMDVFATDDVIIPVQSRSLVGTGITVSWTGPDAENYYLRVAPRSGLAVKSNIDVGAGVIDYDYRGELKVLLINNHPVNKFHVSRGDKIAQLILEKINRPNIVEVSEHSETKRGENGFGSTGF